MPASRTETASTPRTLTILDVSSDSLAASVATSRLAAAGHTVWKVELPSGDPLRARAPLALLQDGRRIGVSFASTASGKHWIGLDTTKAGGREILGDLARSADIVVSSSSSDLGLPNARMTGRQGRVTVTPFGLTGRRSSWRASSFGLYHVGGLGYVSPRAPAEGVATTVAPQAPWGYVAEYFSSVYVALAVSSCAFTLEPVAIDISIQDCLLPLLRREMGAYLADGEVPSRYERLWRVAPSGFYRTADGWVYASVMEDRHWIRLCDVMERPDLADDVRYETAEARFENLADLDEHLAPWFAGRSSAEIFDLAGASGIPIGPALPPSEMATSPQSRLRGSLRQLGPLGEVPTISEAALGRDRGVASSADFPELGEDTARVLARLGWGIERIRAARASGAIRLSEHS